MPYETPLNKQIGLPQALMEIEAIGHQIQQSGNVDSEKDQLRKISEDLTAGTITPEQAIALAKNMLAGRQDYH